MRATGYLRHNEKGEIETDATGKPIYHGASDVLAKSLLGMDQDEQKKGEVSITINVAAMSGKQAEKPPVDVEVGQDDQGGDT